MHRNDCFTSRGFPFQALFRDDVEIIQRNINEYGLRAYACHSQGRCGRADRWNENLVSRPHRYRSQSDRERFGSGTNTDAVRRSAVASKFVLKRLNGGTQNIPAIGEHPMDRIINVIAQRLVSQSDVVEVHGQSLGTIVTPSILKGSDSRVMSE